MSPAAGNDLGGARVGDRLTAKELKIVALIIQGYKNKEIAVQLGTTERVKNYLRNVYDKIGIADRLELALSHARDRFDGWRVGFGNVSSMFFCTRHRGSVGFSCGYI